MVRNNMRQKMVAESIVSMSTKGIESSLGMAPNHAWGSAPIDLLRN